MRAGSGIALAGLLAALPAAASLGVLTAQLHVTDVLQAVVAALDVVHPVRGRGAPGRLGVVIPVHLALGFATHHGLPPVAAAGLTFLPAAARYIMLHGVPHSVGCPLDAPADNLKVRVKVTVFAPAGCLLANFTAASDGGPEVGGGWVRVERLLQGGHYPSTHHVLALKVCLARIRGLPVVLGYDSIWAHMWHNVQCT